MMTVVGGNRYMKHNKATQVCGKLKQTAAHFNVTNKRTNKQRT
jgi:hypothetical protein